MCLYHRNCSETERDLVAKPVRMGGLRLKNPSVGFSATMTCVICKPSCLIWFVTMYKLNRHYNRSQAKTLPEGLIMPLMHLLTSTVGVSGSDRGFHSSSLHCVCHLNADSYRDLSPKEIYRIHEIRSDNTILSSQK